MKHLGGVASNSLTHILQLNNTDSIDEFPPQIIPISYDCEHFISLIKSTNSSNFSAFSSNIQSINAKFPELHAFIVDLESNNINFGVICLQESWLNANDDITQIELDHYNCVIQGKTCSSKGGLMMYIHEKFNYKVKTYGNLCNNWESQIVELSGGGLSKPITICNIYRPPSDLNENYKRFIDELSTLMEIIENKKEVIITGDFNINLLKINEKEIFCEFLKSLISHSYFPKITFPTRFSRTTGTLIDNFFCKL